MAGFEKATGIGVAIRNNDEDVFDAEILAEGSRSPADVLFTENSPALEFLQKRGLLAPVDRSTLAHTPNRYNSPDGDWVGVSARVSVIIYNPSLIKKNALPTHVLQLAEPRFLRVNSRLPPVRPTSSRLSHLFSTRTARPRRCGGWMASKRMRAATSIPIMKPSPAM